MGADLALMIEEFSRLIAAPLAEVSGPDQRPGGRAVEPPGFSGAGFRQSRRLRSGRHYLAAATALISMSRLGRAREETPRIVHAGKSAPHRHPRAGATCVRIASIACAQ